MRSAILRWALGAALIGVAMPGCSDNKNDIAKGRRYAQQGNYAEAHKAFDVALAADPNDYNALWGKADTYRREGNLPKQAELLEKILGNAEMGQTYGSVVNPALEENYRKQAEQRMAKPAEAEAFLRKAIGIEKKSEANLTLANLLYKQGKDLQAAGTHGEAIAFYDKALELRMPRALRRKITAQKEVSEFMKFKADFEPTWQKVKPTLIEAKQYDEKTDTIFVTTEVEVEGDPKAETYEADADRQALAAVTDALYTLTWTVAGKERPEGATVAYSAALVSVVEKGFTKDRKPAKYSYRISLPRDAVVEQAGKIQRGEFKAAEPAAPEGGAAPDAGAAPGSAAAPASAP